MAAAVCQVAAAQWWGGLVTAVDWANVAFSVGGSTLLQYKCIEAVTASMDAPSLMFR